MATASELIKTADRTGEKATRRFTTPAAPTPPKVNIKPTLDPASYSKQAQDISSASFDSSGVAGAFTRANQSGTNAVAALDFIEEKYKTEERKKIPSGDMQAEIQKLITQKFRVLPQMLADPGIKDWRQKVQLANQATAQLDTTINQILAKKTELEDAADERARTKVSELKAKASMLDKQSQMDQFELQQRMELYKTGKADLQSILEFAIQMNENNSKRGAAGSDNPFIGAGAATTAGFAATEVSQFLYFEKFKKFNVSDTSKMQLEPYLTLRYQQWSTLGKPVGTVQQGPGEGKAGPVFRKVQTANDADFTNPFPDPNPDPMAAMVQALMGGGGGSGNVPQFPSKPK